MNMKKVGLSKGRFKDRINTKNKTFTAQLLRYKNTSVRLTMLLHATSPITAL